MQSDHLTTALLSCHSESQRITSWWVNAWDSWQHTFEGSGSGSPMDVVLSSQVTGFKASSLFTRWGLWGELIILTYEMLWGLHADIDRGTIVWGSGELVLAQKACDQLASRDYRQLQCAFPRVVPTLHASVKLSTFQLQFMAAVPVVRLTSLFHTHLETKKRHDLEWKWGRQPR